ncbi:TetR family transcriptional regulator [Micromonospora yangpuensis]|uniref:Transcriptional regulator, TetR family n=1 Tax=Micromonospora yangpuensis TaxID=683228 RepID=A0A1C6V8L6_9ACTN|nr:TetR family transcriptional regulator [Micromonospora yangpuensis]SCL62230.1 transcriptional regulator, TetR family [Micromonospora yangpuensis]
MARAVPETRDEILAAAARRFAVSGYKATSLQDIAREVGCSKAAVLYHFASKEALLGELMGPAIAGFQAMVDRLTWLTGTVAQEAAVNGFVDLAVRFRREIALLGADLPELLLHPEFSHVHQGTERLIAALAGSDRPTARIAALVLLAGIAHSCPELVDVPDDELRTALLAVSRRAVEPADPPGTSTGHPGAPAGHVAASTDHSGAPAGRPTPTT